MRHIVCEQGSREWLHVKAGVVSASNLHRVMTPSKMKLAAASEGYCHELLAEQVLGRPLDDATTSFMQRGTEYEQKARDWYSLQRDTDIERVGFLLRDDGRVGCSPDALVGTVGGLEIKVPSAKTHMGYLIDGVDENYRCQIQGSLWITGRRWWDFVSYNPELPSLLVRIERDEAFIAALDKTCAQFLAYVDECKDRLRGRGLFANFAPEPLRVVA